MKKVVFITSCLSTSSRLNGPISLAKDTFQELGFEVNQIEVTELPADDLIRANACNECISEKINLIKQTDAVLIATPIYQGSYSGVLKSFLDLIPQNGFHGKSILPLVIGGTQSHLLMIEYALKPLCSVLGSRRIAQGVFVRSDQVSCIGNDMFDIEFEALSRIKQSVYSFVNEENNLAIQM